MIKQVRISNPELRKLLTINSQIPGRRIYEWLKESASWAAPHKNENKPNPTKAEQNGIKIEQIVSQWWADWRIIQKSNNTKLVFRKIVDDDYEDILNPDMIEVRILSRKITEVMGIAVTGSSSMTFDEIGGACTGGPLIAETTVKGFNRMRELGIPFLVLYYDINGAIYIATDKTIHNKGKEWNKSKESRTGPKGVRYTFDEFPFKYMLDEPSMEVFQGIISSSRT